VYTWVLYVNYSIFFNRPIRHTKKIRKCSCYLSFFQSLNYILAINAMLVAKYQLSLVLQFEITTENVSCWYKTEYLWVNSSAWKDKKSNIEILYNLLFYRDQQVSKSALEIYLTHPVDLLDPPCREKRYDKVNSYVAPSMTNTQRVAKNVWESGHARNQRKPYDITLVFEFALVSIQEIRHSGKPSI